MIDDAGDGRVAFRVAPKDEVAVGDVGGGQVDVVFNQRLAAELQFPVGQRLAKLRLGPLGGQAGHRLAGRSDHEEAIHERIIDWPLQAGALGQAGEFKPADGPPSAECVDEERLPRAVGADACAAQFISVDHDGGVAVGPQRAKPGRYGQNEARDVFSGQLDAFVAGDARLDAGWFPVRIKAVNPNPGLAIVAQRPRHESHLAWHRVAALGGGGVDALVDFRLGCGVIFVAGVRADHVVQCQAFVCEVARHDIRGLLLFVDLAAVRDGGGVEQVAGVFRGVVKPPKRLLMGGWHRVFPGQAEVLERLGKTGSRCYRHPVASEVGAQVPATAAAHREAANAHPVVVHGILFLRVGERLEHIDFAGEFERVAEAAVRVEDDCVGRGELPGGGAALLDEFQFAQLVVAAVQPDVEAAFAPRVGGDRLRDHEPVRLHRVVESGDVAAHDEAGGACPRCLATGQLHGAFAAGDEQLFGGFEFAWLEKDPVIQRPVNGLVIDLHIGEVAEQRRRIGVLPGQGVDRLAKRVGARAQLGAGVVGKLDADGGNAGRRGDERLGRFIRLAKRVGGEAKRHDDAYRDAVGD